MANTKATNVKKPKRRMKKQIRRTVAGVLLASAVVVAAIPTPEVMAKVDQAEPIKVVVKSAHPTLNNDPTGAAHPYNSTVPFVSDVPTTREAEKTVYTDENGLFQFVYMQPTSTNPNKVAVILNYTGSETSLTIPNTLEGYKKYRDNDTSSGYCLVSKKNEFLHYLTRKQKVEAGVKYFWVSDMYEEPAHTKLEVSENQCEYRDGNLVYVEVGSEHIEPTAPPTPTPDPVDPSLTPTPQPAPTPYDRPTEIIHQIEPCMIEVYEPCYNTTKSEWVDVPEADLFYSTDKINFYACGSESDHQRINADVAFIGQEKLIDDGYGGWKVDGPITNPDEGIFANNPSLTYLEIGSNMQGIGDFAFYGCSTLNSVKFSAKLETVGNGAFAECIRLTNCDLAYNSNLLALGKDAFYNCRSLSTFYTNVGLLAIGDSCFEGCNHLTNIYLNGENAPGGAGEVALRYMGNHAFKDCNALSCLEFPYSYGSMDTMPLDMDMFDGCSSLQYIKILNSSIDFDAFHCDSTSPAYPRCSDNTWDYILNTSEFHLPDSFYFEGPATSAIHDRCKQESIAFKYLDEVPDLFEIKEFEYAVGDDPEHYPDVKSAALTYQIHTDGSIVKVLIDGDPVNVTIPETIGPYGIDTIGEGAFDGNCSLTKVTIPESCTTIGPNAFKGCHNLEVVTFTAATKILSIGEDAFRTQDCMYTGSKNAMKCSACNEILDYPTAKLTFCGAMLDPVTNIDTVPFQYAMNGVSSINNKDQSVSWITYHSGWPTNMEVQYDYDSVSKEGIVKLVGYPRFEQYESVATSDEYLKSLPYVTADNKDYYKELISEAVQAYKDYVTGVTSTPPTDTQMELINSALNIVVPTNVDAIKTGLFSGKDADGNPVSPVIDPNTTIQTITLNGVTELEPYTFADCTELKEASIIGPTYVGDYCFDNDASLQSVALGANILDTGLRPFSGCTILDNINPLGSNFEYNNGLLFRIAPEGKELVECLEGRGNVIGSYNVNANELAGIHSVKPEAFMNCENIGKIDMTSAGVDVIPKRCFYNVSDVNSIILGSGTTQIEEEAFNDTISLRTVTLPYSIVQIAQDAFANNEKGSGVSTGSFKDTAHSLPKIIVSCVENSTADKYAKAYVYMQPEYGDVRITHVVYFYDDCTGIKKLLDKQIVNDGEAAIPPDAPDHSDEGYIFERWTEYTNIVKDTDVYAKYVPKGDPVFRVDFLNADGKKICETQYISEGKNAKPPEDPTHPTKPEFEFVGWSSEDYIGVHGDPNDPIIIMAEYRDPSGDTSRHTITFYSSVDNSLLGTLKVDDGGSVTTFPQPPTVQGYYFSKWSPSADQLTDIRGPKTVIAVYLPNSSPQPTQGPQPTGAPGATPTPTPTPNNQAEAKKYTVTVSGGSGTGTYAAGSIVAINAYDMGAGQSFDKWTTSTAGVGFAAANQPSTYFVMPAANVAVTATFKAGGGSSSGGSAGGSSSNAGTNNKTGNTNANSSPGTTVQVTKGGISNTGVAGASVSGSTDNFVVKITDDQNASDLALTALQNKFGDITNIKYLPMDISLYDSTGRTKIADTSGMSVSITLPLPDEMATYAGNNKIASVAGGNIEDLNSRFTTVDGVPCISFTATHFSPYVIYVDTANLTQTTIDYTPKTGDPIHPKWFLSIGLACVSVILFFKKDRRKVKVSSK